MSDMPDGWIEQQRAKERAIRAALPPALTEAIGGVALPLDPSSESPTHPDAPRAGGETPILYCATCGYHPVVPAGQLGEICAWCRRDSYRVRPSAGPSPERASK